MDTLADFARTDSEYLDVLIVGAGLSGIGAAWHLQDTCPGRSYAIVEARESSGGTWDLFRYPGIRSDSDMYTLGYSFRPWKDAKAIADGPAILSYIREVASDHGIDARIRYGHRVVAARWSTPDARWTVEIEQGPEKRKTRVTCGFLWMCSGYYDYAAGYTPEFPGVERFKGRIVHPQKWTEDIDYKNKKVVVIGSGATAVTLVPAMAPEAAHVTMLQRSPTYVVARPAEDSIANRLRRRLPIGLAYGLTRWKNVLLGMYFYQLCKRRPDRAKAMILKGVRYFLGSDYDVEKHFTPRYNPWDQRLCLVPDADLFRAIRARQVSVVTDQIETFTETGIRLKSGSALEADLVVTATGLALQLLGGMTVEVDGKIINPADTLAYKGMMYSDVPNFAVVSGYTNASWTLKADLVCEYVCRLLNHMQKNGLRQCTPRLDDPDMERLPWVDFSSGYIQRAVDKFPKQGARRPWRLHQNYAMDLMSLRYGSLRDKAMVFSR
ncbi:Predicted flavoprotein CzcO associated with the cation diffusion facilitator CzcD [Rhodospirillales bacterium URHD0017]|nr:Predicted flavoprotein CzcO associated with the cation diffusion facilitator CzcD [Rhodospirillales bacterium URHD0017]